ncbi:MAG TPA: prepilin-type N-terminal cleavage/methylation domain-containing protein [Gammaproteobacteria bacterium]|jgi:prepilin-type N-terminal cleavage/methylation domain-containing protein|nr:prepilin-type N-terminal cleavage/methylation domain-containing protein [Gammaproteobacteria bacterium]
MKKYLGFSLLELILVMVVMGIVVAASSSSIMEGLENFTTSKNFDRLDWQANMAIEEIARKARTITRSASITTATATQFTFVDSTNTTQSYTLSGGKVLENSNILVENATNLTFTYYTKLGATTATISAIRFVKVSITVAIGSYSYTYTTTANLQNIP